MNVLGIETSTQVCAVALVNEKGLIAETRLNLKNIHAQRIHTMIDDLFTASDLTFEDLAGIAVSIGPGSFTGLRIGLATAKGLAIATLLPLAAVPTMYGLAAQAPVLDGTIAAIIRSRKNEYYAALFERKNGKDELLKDVTIVTLDELLSLIPPNALLIGHTQELLTFNNKIAPAHKSIPEAYSIARIGLQYIKDNNIQPIDKIEPVYHQDFIAGKPKAPVVSI